MKPKIDGRLRHMDISRFLQRSYNAYLMRILPLSVMQSYVSFLGNIYYYIYRHEYIRIIHIIDHLIGRNSKDLYLQDTVARVFTGIFTHYTEKLFIGYARLNKTLSFLKNNIDIVGSSVVKKAMAQKRGLILVTGHYGAVEFLPSVVGLQRYPVTMLLRFKNKNLKKALTKRIRKADHVNIELVEVDESRNVMFEALKALKKNRIVITECDEFEQWSACKHRRNKFLGKNVPFDRSLDLLHRRSKAPVIMGIIKRVPGYRYELRYQSLKPTSPKQAASISQQALSILEKYITDDPAQWYQWKEVEHVININHNEEQKSIHACEEDRYLPLEDTPVHAF